MKKLDILLPLLVGTGLLITSCAREEETSCSEPQIEPGTETITDLDKKQCPEPAKADVSKKEY
ncbi:hypothetical protein [uncultured Fluviicola sp.]|uniref:hypothetical protein n=1 Tax=uncultured Fluviicola sp. TaxID=463303 RepID=UPI0025DE9E89|nr:hypothetical protein [uncultured Fluviicola sp.]